MSRKMSGDLDIIGQVPLDARVMQVPDDDYMNLGFRARDRMGWMENRTQGLMDRGDRASIFERMIALSEIFTFLP